LIKAVVSTLGDNYPERLAAVYMYPAGGLASMVLRIVSPLMDPRTVSKVHLLSPRRLALPLTTDPDPNPDPKLTRALFPTAIQVHLLTSEALLREHIPDAYVPVRYGGTSTFEFDPAVYEPAAGS
tara:strand:+ start:216 stop:590 length:375 start_codon:yes stop_codon:yes gene_type:complete